MRHLEEATLEKEKRKNIGEEEKVSEEACKAAGCKGRPRRRWLAKIK